MRIAYLDCFSGISGDMALGALVDAGADLEGVVRAIEALPVGQVLIEREAVETHGLQATRIHVKAAPRGVIRTYGSIRTMLEGADLPEGTVRRGARIFHRLALAEATVHRKELELVTFHEEGELDCVVEIVGFAVGLELLGVERVFASAIPTGFGMMRTEHGMTPIPSPVVSELLQNVPTYSRGIPVELVTPTGAAMLAAVVEGYGDMPLMRAERVGYGAGHPRQDFPNALRVVIGEEERIAHPADAGPATPAGWVLVEAGVIGRKARDLGSAVDQAYSAGAAEAWLTPTIGKGGAAGAILSAIVPAARAEDMVRSLQAVGGCTGVRSTPVQIHPESGET